MVRCPALHGVWQRARLRVSLSEFLEQRNLLAGSRKFEGVPDIWIIDGTKLVVESVFEAVREGQVEESISTVFPPSSTLPCSPKLFSR